MVLVVLHKNTHTHRTWHGNQVCLNTIAFPCASHRVVSGAGVGVAWGWNEHVFAVVEAAVPPQPVALASGSKSGTSKKAAAKEAEMRCVFKLACLVFVCIAVNCRMNCTSSVEYVTYVVCGSLLLQR